MHWCDGDPACGRRFHAQVLEQRDVGKRSRFEDMGRSGTVQRLEPAFIHGRARHMREPRFPLRAGKGKPRFGIRFGKLFHGREQGAKIEAAQTAVRTSRIRRLPVRDRDVPYGFQPASEQQQQVVVGLDAELRRDRPPCRTFGQEAVEVGHERRFAIGLVSQRERAGDRSRVGVGEVAGIVGERDGIEVDASE